MPRLSPTEVAAYALEAGFRREDAVVATAVALAESSGVTDNVGDEDLVGERTATGETWGPSIGLWQIRSIQERKGTGDKRDAAILTDPNRNAASAHALSRTPRGWRHWTMFTNRTYRDHMDRARAGVNEAARLIGTGKTADQIANLSNEDKFVDVGPTPGSEETDPSHMTEKGPLESLGDIAAFLGNRDNWVRIGVGAGGVVILLAGVVILARDAIGGAVVSSVAGGAPGVSKAVADAATGG